MPLLIDGIDDEQDNGLGNTLLYGGVANGNAAPVPPAQPMAAPVAAAPAPVAPVQPAAPAQNTYTDAQGNYIAPVYHAPDTTALQGWETRKTADSVISDPKVNAPKWWERTLGGLSAGAMAFGHIPGAVEAGQAVTNRRFNAAELERHGRLQADDAGIAAERGNIAQGQQNWERGAQGFNMQLNADRAQQLNADRQAQETQRRQALAPGTEQPDDPKNPGGSWHATTVDGKPIALNGPPDAWLKTPSGKKFAEAQERDARYNDGLKRGLKGQPLQEYALTGKIEKQPVTNIHVPSADAEMFHSWEQGLGHKPTSEDILDYKRGGRPADAKQESTPQQRSKLLADRDKAYGDVETKYRSLRDAAGSDQERAEIDAQREAEKASLNRQYDSRFSQLDAAGQQYSGGQQQPAAGGNNVTPSFSGGKAPGMTAPGNIDLSKRPNIDNHDGTHSSVFSMGVNIDGKEMLIPGVGDGKTFPLRKLTVKEAVQQYKKTGQNLGTFATPQDSDRYAETLHEDQARGNAPAPVQQQQAAPPARPVAPAPQVAAPAAAVQRAPKPGAALADVSLARQYLAKAGGDKGKARQLAAADGWKF